MATWLERPGEWATKFDEQRGIVIRDNALFPLALRTYVKQNNWQYRNGKISEDTLRMLDNRINSYSSVSKELQKAGLPPLAFSSIDDLEHTLSRAPLMTVKVEPGLYVVPGAVTKNYDYFA